MATKFLSKTMKLDVNAYADIMNTVVVTNKELTTITAVSQYKFVSEAINSTELETKRVKKSIKQLMQQSFFHGKSWMGENFIA